MQKEFAPKQLAVIFETTLASIFIGYVNCDLNSNERRCNNNRTYGEILIALWFICMRINHPEFNSQAFLVSSRTCFGFI